MGAFKEFYGNIFFIIYSMIIAVKLVYNYNGEVSQKLVPGDIYQVFVSPHTHSGF